MQDILHGIMDMILEIKFIGPLCISVGGKGSMKDGKDGDGQDYGECEGYEQKM